tara:strand:+ start:10961 stop:11383 length:423 start_codon:yes stop_codon:yes gene_type:complete
MQLQRLPDPTLPTQDWLVAKTRLCGLCGSDYKQVFMNGRADNPMTSMISWPQVLGHEVVGKVIRTGDISSTKGLSLGRTVRSAGHYDLIARAGACGNISNCYTLEAVPRGVQNEDIDCGTLSVDSLGTRDATGLQTSNCW